MTRLSTLNTFVTAMHACVHAPREGEAALRVTSDPAFVRRMLSGVAELQAQPASDDGRPGGALMGLTLARALPW